MNFLNTIQQRYMSMSPVEKRIADCILEDPEMMTKSTVIYIAKKAGVSQGSVTNFAISLGASGFSQLKINIAQNLPASTSPSNTGEKNKVMHKMLESAKISFETTLDSLAEEDFKAAAEMLLNADRIIVVGFAHSAPVALDIATRLLSIGLPAQVINDALTANVACARLNEKGVLLAISHSGRTRDSLACAKTAKNVKAGVIGFTSYSVTPLSEISDITFVAVSNETQNYRESMTARLTQLIIGDCLVEYIAQKIGNDAVERQDSTAEIFESNREKLLFDYISD